MNQKKNRVKERKYNKKQVGILVFMLLLVPVFMLISLRIGYTDIDFMHLLQIFLGKGSKTETMFVLTFRLPRICIALLTGIGFSVSGCILQGITKNPLADPGILGINSGAGLVVLLFLTLKGTLDLQSVFVMPFFSFLGALATGFLVYGISISKEKGLDTTRMLLNGIAIQASINGFMMILVMKLDADQHEFLALWQAGSIWRSNWKLVAALIPWIFIGFFLSLAFHKQLDVLTLGHETSIGLGLDAKKTKKRLLAIAMGMAGCSVAFSGSISFLGFIAPHIARRIVGSKSIFLLPASALMGGSIMILTDTLARKILEPAEIPTGIVVAALGAPYFIFLMLMENNKYSMKKRQGSKL